MIELNITDVIGRKVTTLISGHQRSGNHNVMWTGKDRNGNQVPSGIYFYRLSFGDQSLTKKMVLNR
jgi:flagellar hook assembly protein FlgD